MQWCGRGDLNPHAFRRHPLKMVCLPVPPLPHGCETTPLGRLDYSRRNLGLYVGQPPSAVRRAKLDGLSRPDFDVTRNRASRLVALLAPTRERKCSDAVLVPRRQQHLLRTMLNRNGNGNVRNIRAVFRPQRRLYSAKLLRSRGSSQRRGRCQPAADRLLHLIEVSRAHKALVLHRLVSVLLLTGKFLLLQSRVSGHSGFLVMSRQLKHAQVQGMEARQGHELILVSHASQLRLKARNRFFVELLAPIEAGRAVVSQQLARILRVDWLGELPGLL